MASTGDGSNPPKRPRTSDDVAGIPTSGVSCLTPGCEFAGSVSGHCSVCFRGLSDEEKARHTREQRALEPERKARVESELEERLKTEKEEAARKKAATEEQERLKEEREAEMQKRKDEGLCYCMHKLEWREFAVVDSDGDDLKILNDSSVEVWSCGLVSPGEDGWDSRESHAGHMDDPAVARLHSVREKIVNLLDGVYVMTDTDSPWLSFTIPDRKSEEAGEDDDLMTVMGKYFNNPEEYNALDDIALDDNPSDEEGGERKEGGEPDVTNIFMQESKLEELEGLEEEVEENGDEEMDEDDMELLQRLRNERDRSMEASKVFHDSTLEGTRFSSCYGDEEGAICFPELLGGRLKEGGGLVVFYHIKVHS